MCVFKLCQISYFSCIYPVAFDHVLFSGNPLRIGQYIDCMINIKDKMPMLLEEKRTVDVIIEPRKVYRACVSDDVINISFQISLCRRLCNLINY